MWPDPSADKPVFPGWGCRWLLLTLLVWGLQGCEQAPPTPSLRIGQVVPPLAVEDLHRRPAVIEAVPGKLLMLNVWATWCAPCRHEMPSLQRLAARLGSERLRLVGLSVDMDDHVVREYLIENKITFPSFLDSDLSEVNGALGVRVFPSTFFIRPDGRLAKVIEGWREWDDPQQVEEIRRLLPDS